MSEFGHLRPIWKRLWWLVPFVWLVALPVYLIAGLLNGAGWWVDEGTPIWHGLRAVARRLWDRRT
jgi:hypothetical protein